MQYLKTIQAVIFIARAIIDLVAYLSGRINLAEYNKRLREIDTAITKAGTGILNDRLQGGRDVEDNINRNAGDL